MHQHTSLVQSYLPLGQHDGSAQAFQAAGQASSPQGFAAWIPANNPNQQAYAVHGIAHTRNTYDASTPCMLQNTVANANAGLLHGDGITMMPQGGGSAGIIMRSANSSGISGNVPEEDEGNAHNSAGMLTNDTLQSSTSSQYAGCVSCAGLSSGSNGAMASSNSAQKVDGNAGMPGHSAAGMPGYANTGSFRPDSEANVYVKGDADLYQHAFAVGQDQSSHRQRADSNAAHAMSANNGEIEGSDSNKDSCALGLSHSSHPQCHAFALTPPAHSQATYQMKSSHNNNNDNNNNNNISASPHQPHQPFALGSASLQTTPSPSVRMGTYIGAGVDAHAGGSERGALTGSAASQRQQVRACAYVCTYILM
jgi:hypothetical protein